MRINVRRIQESIAADFDVSLDLFFSPSRVRPICRPRQYAMLLARELTPLSVTVLGRLFGRDHSTISTGVRSAKRLIANDRDLALKIEARKLLLMCEGHRPPAFNPHYSQVRATPNLDPVPALTA